MAEARAEFESLIKPFEKKHHDDLCEAWAIKQPTIHDAFLQWVPLARKTFDLEEKLVDDFTVKASPGVLDAFTTALRAAKRRLDDETAAANAVVLDPRAAKKAAKLAEKARLKKEAEEEEGGGKAKKAQKKVRTQERARHFTRGAGRSEPTLKLTLPFYVTPQAIKEAEQVAAAGGADAAAPLKIKSVKAPKHKGIVLSEKDGGTPTPKAA